MKKVLFIFVMCIITMCVNAQKWENTVFPADDFKGTTAYTAYTYTDNTGMFVFWSNKDNQYKLVSKVGMFNYDSGYSKYSGNYCGITVKVGLYDNNNKMIDKFDMWLDCDKGDGPVTTAYTRDRGAMFNPVGQAKKVKKIMKHLKNEKGYVRFFTDLYNANDFDFKVPCIKN